MIDENQKGNAGQTEGAIHNSDASQPQSEIQR
jgi:hypothetical protein